MWLAVSNIPIFDWIIFDVRITKSFSMYLSKTTLRIRYGETDQMGVAYHGNYAQYFEVARVEALRELGISYRDLENDGVMLPVVELQTKFIKPALYDDAITIHTYIKELPQVRFYFEYEVFNEGNVLLTTGKTTLVFVNKETGRPMHAPEHILQLITPQIQS